MAKYAAMLTILAIPCLIMALYPLILTAYGTVHLAATYSTLLAFFLLGASLISIGMFISSLTESQVIAAVISLGVMVLLNFMAGLAGMIPQTGSASLACCIIIAVIIGAVVQLMIKNSVISISAGAVLAAGCVLAYLIAPAMFEGLIPALLGRIALFDLLVTFQNGIFDLTSVIMYVSVAALFVYLTVQSMEKKRWN